MTGTRIPLSTPSFSLEDESEVLQGIRSVLRSGWLTSGKNVETLEKDFAKAIGTRFAVALSSGTAALHAMLVALDIKAGDEVIVPTDSFVATANSVLYTGAKPILADSDPDTFNVSPIDVENKMSRRTKAIIAVHLGGNPCEMSQLSEIAERHELTLLEDCAHAHGAQFRGGNCGTFGTAAAFSLYATKVVTGAEGGIVTTNEERIAERVLKLRNHGRGGYGPVETTELGYNYRMSDIHAVIARNQLKHLSEFVHNRNQISTVYNDFFRGTNWAKPQLVRKDNVCSYYAYLVKLTDESPLSRDELVRRLAEQEIGTSVLYYPIHSQPYYKQILEKDPICPVAEKLAGHTLALPMHSSMQDSEVHVVTQALRNAFQRDIETHATAV